MYAPLAITSNSLTLPIPALCLPTISPPLSLLLCATNQRPTRPNTRYTSNLNRSGLSCIFNQINICNWFVFNVNEYLFLLRFACMLRSIGPLLPSRTPFNLSKDFQSVLQSHFPHALSFFVFIFCSRILFERGKEHSLFFDCVFSYCFSLFFIFLWPYSLFFLFSGSVLIRMMVATQILTVRGE